MMAKKEMKKWFRNMFNSCYAVEDNKYPGNYFLYYDKQFIRQMKLCIITDEKINYPETPSGDKLFYLNFENEYIECDYDKMISFFKSNYLPNHNKIKEVIRTFLKEYDNFSKLKNVEDELKMMLMTDDEYINIKFCFNQKHFLRKLIEHDKLSIYFCKKI